MKVINISEVKEKGRIDARPFISNNATLVRLSKRYPSFKIGETSFIHKVRNRNSRVYVKDKSRGLMYLSNTDMQSTNFDNVPYMSKKFISNIAEQKLKKGDIIVSAVGTIGQVTYVDELLEGAVISGNILRFTPKKYPGFIYAYMKSKFGQANLVNIASGSVQDFITPPKLYQYDIPQFPTEKVIKAERLIKESSGLRVTAHKLLKHVRSTFDEILRFSESHENISNYTSININENFHKRFDSAHYLRINEATNELAKGKYHAVELGSLVSRKMFTAQRGKRNYVKQNGIRFLSTTNISERNPLLVEKYLSLNTNGLETLVVDKNWILISSSGQDILGSAFIVDSTYAGCAVNQHSLRVIVDEDKISPFYLYGYLSTPKIKQYIRSGIYGSAVLTIDENFLKRLKVPILSEKEMNVIANNTKKAIQSIEKACFIEKEAIELIEKEMESWQG